MVWGKVVSERVGRARGRAVEARFRERALLDRDELGCILEGLLRRVKAVIVLQYGLGYLKLKCKQSVLGRRVRETEDARLSWRRGRQRVCAPHLSPARFAAKYGPLRAAPPELVGTARTGC